MRFHSAILILLIGGFIVAVPYGNAAFAQDAEPTVDIVARIGDEAVVTRREFERSLTAMAGGQTGVEIPHDEQLELLNDIVNIKLQYVLATKSGVDITDDELAAEVEKRTGHMAPEQFEAGLAGAGMTKDEYTGLIEEQMTVAKYRQQQSDKVEPVTEAGVAAEYEELNRDGRFDRVDVSHILILVEEGSDDAAWTEAKKRIDDAHKRVTTGGEDFATVAREVTDDPGSKESGGAYPNTPRGKMVPEFEERMFSIEVGKVSEPFRTAYGWHILTPTKRFIVPLEEVAAQIQVYVTERSINDLVMKQVAEAKSAMDIEIRLDAADAPAS